MHNKTSLDRVRWSHFILTLIYALQACYFVSLNVLHFLTLQFYSETTNNNNVNKSRIMPNNNKTTSLAKTLAKISLITWQKYMCYILSFSTYHSFSYWRSFVSESNSCSARLLVSLHVRGPLSKCADGDSHLTMLITDQENF